MNGICQKHIGDRNLAIKNNAKGFRDHYENSSKISRDILAEEEKKLNIIINMSEVDKAKEKIKDIPKKADVKVKVDEAEYKKALEELKKVEKEYQDLLNEKNKIASTPVDLFAKDPEKARELHYFTAGLNKSAIDKKYPEYIKAKDKVEEIRLKFDTSEVDEAKEKVEEIPKKVDVEVKADTSEVDVEVKADTSEVDEAKEKVEEIPEKVDVEVKADTSEVDKVKEKVEEMPQAVEGTTKKTKSFSNATSFLSAHWLAVTTAIFAVGKGIMTAFNLAKNFVSKLDSMAKKAKSVGMSPTAYSSVEHAAHRAGVEMDKILNILQKVDNALTAAGEGQAKYRDAFYEIGLSWRDLDEMSPEKRLMAIVGALSKMKDLGRNIPTGIIDIVGKRDMQTVNKMLADKDFNKNIMSAFGLGFSADERTLAIAERLSDAVGDMSDKTLAMVTKWETMQKAMTITANVMEKLTQLTGKTGELPDFLKKQGYIGIADVTKDYIRNNFSREQKENFLYDNQIIHPDRTMNSPLEVKTKIYKMKDEEIDKALDEWLKENNINSKYFKYAEEKDYRFNKDDPTTWVQEDKNKPPKTPRSEAEDKVRDNAEELARILKGNVDKLEETNDLKDIEVDVEKKIFKLETELKKITRRPKCPIR